MAPNALQLQRSPYERRILESQSELESLNKRISEERDILRKDAAEARKPRSISQADAFASGLLQLAPALIGYAISDTEGALAGLQGGATGGSQYLSAVRDRLKQEREADIADIDERRDILGQRIDEREDLERGLDRLEIEDLKLEGRKQIAATKDQSLSVPPEIKKLIVEAQNNPDGLYGLSKEDQFRISEASPKEFDRLARAAENRYGRNQTDESRQKYIDFLNKGREDKLEARDVFVTTEDGKALKFGRARTPKEAIDASESIENYEEMRNTLKEIEDVYTAEGDTLRGEGYQRLQSALGNLEMILKGPNYFNLGAALTESEIERMKRITPETFANAENLRDVLIARGFGRDFISKLDSLSDRTDRDFKTQIESKGFSIPNSYDPLRNYNYRFEDKRDAPVEQEEVETKTLEDFGGDRRKHLEYLRSKYGR